MPFLFQKHRNYKLGVEVCTHQLRFSVLAQQQTVWQLVDADIISLPSTSEEAWLLLQKRCKPYGRKLILGIALNDVLIKSYYLSATCNDQEINVYLQHQAQALLSLSKDELALDYEKWSTQDKQKKLVRMVAARKQWVMQLVYFCQQVNLTVMTVEVAALAFKRLLKFIKNEVDHSAFLLLEKKFLIYGVIQQQEIIFIKQIDYILTESQQGLTPDYIKTLINQAQQYYASQNQQSAPQKIYFAGELADRVRSLVGSDFNMEIIPFIVNEQLLLNSITRDQTLFPFLGSIGLALWNKKE